ncbi:MAG: exonuclease SbcCD subunit D C-terminal domain-containing protein [Psychrobacter sp.]|uniref:exonuclease SbcCD subunit D C-terminal domain-containing protein n=1 Tax=unclassified Psychrobacter TaxID=196806 RepID=UPI001787A148|nr:exonuclease SbcCD subunit D C-terminal domain-containing protein [Psychrobacter sp. FME13]MBE0441706.1 exonuclease SbcCD subunit D C-terminal domain-containing protein [Psychrobacter sp. FME13]
MPVLAALPLTILHTSDWHLGRRLYGHMRYSEFEAFLSWLEETISTQKVDVLIVAGDIFDTMTPSNRAQALYYEFLGKVSKSCCQHIIIVAGNHDSPTFLDAPSQILKFLNVHVIGTACDDVNDEVLLLNNAQGVPSCIIVAVPYLRDRDVRSSGAGESMDSKDASVINGICAHYDAVAAIAKSHQQTIIKTHNRHIPIIATGHLFASGGSTTADDGVRDLYIGNLGKISAEMFDECFDYVALGHLHVPQRVGGREHIRYSGSPIAMGFGEAKQQKQALLIQFGAALDDIKENIDNKSHHESISEAPAANLTSDMAQLSNTSTKPEVSVEKPTTKKADSQTDFIDDLFGFDDAIIDESISSGKTNNSAQEDIGIEAESSSEDNNTEEKATQTDIAQSIIGISKSTPLTFAFAAQLLHHDVERQMQVLSLPIPRFQKLAQISGDLQTIQQTIDSTIQSLAPSESVWLELIYTGDDIVSDLREQIQVMVDGLPCEVLKIKNPRTYNKVLNQEAASETLQDLNEMQVFERCLSANEVTDAQKLTLRDAYAQIIHNIHNDDTQAE